MEMLEMRIIRLEENVYFLEERLKELDNHMREQQDQLDAIEKNFQQLNHALQDIRTLLSSSAAKIPAQPPPHYGPQTW